MLSALAELERQAVAVDGGRLKLEWGVLRARRTDVVQDLLWWEEDRLVGFLGLYAFGAPDVELVGAVHPDFRRRGIASALLDAALPLCRDCRYEQILLVVPRSSIAGRALARRSGANLDHSEHALVLADAPDAWTREPRITVRAAAAPDLSTVSRLLADAFGRSSTVTLDGSEQLLVVELDGDVVGCLRVSTDHDGAGIYGFAVERSLRGRGIGREVLRRVCADLIAEGAPRVGLEVAVDNDRALGLYTSIGFTRVTTEDYYALPSATGV